MRLLIVLAIFVASCFALPSTCESFTSDQTTQGTWNAPSFFFGINDSPNGVAVYLMPLSFSWNTLFANNFNTNPEWATDSMNTLSQSVLPVLINGIPLSGGKNLTSPSAANFSRTADFTCSNDNQTITWGPAYPDYTQGDLQFRGRLQFLETYVQWSAPSSSSYFRQVVFVTNKSNKPQRLNVHSRTSLDTPSQDLSPENDGRYLVGFPWHFNDPGQVPNVRLTTTVLPHSFHARGKNAGGANAFVHLDHDCYDLGLFHLDTLAAGETKAVMFVTAFAPNVTRMLDTAAWIDSEPKELFHELTADQLSQIANWGACQSALGPDVTVTVTPPSSCSSGTTSDFAVSVTTSRNDLSDFKHRVVISQADEDIEIVPAQTSTTLSVPNDVGQVKHQLWYKSCIVKETSFTACEKGSTQIVPGAVPNAQSTPQGTTSVASLVQASTFLIALCALTMRSSTTVHLCVLMVVLLASNAFAISNVCHPFTNEMTTYDPAWTYPATFNFGINDSPNGEDTVYSARIDFAWYTQGAQEFNSNWWVSPKFENQVHLGTIGTFMINGVYVLGGKNFTQYALANYVRTANFVCSNDNQTIMWGPAYPDYRDVDYRVRGQFQHLETYVQVSAPHTTSYMRFIIWVTNKSNKQDRLAFHQTNYFDDFANDLSPINDGRYIAPFPWLENDPGDGGKETYNKQVTSIHARGVGARERRANMFIDADCRDTSLHYNGKIEAGETKALMVVFSFAPNVTRMLQSAAWIDSEPKELFHGLTADQLSQIVNWGACQSALGPDVTVTVTPPSSCSSGTTSDFTVSVTTSRNDFTSDFTHRVISASIQIEVVPAQTSTTLEVPNGANQLKHQLWYNGCLIKETAFTACSV